MAEDGKLIYNNENWFNELMSHELVKLFTKKKVQLQLTGPRFWVELKLEILESGGKPITSMLGDWRRENE